MLEILKVLINKFSTKHIHTQNLLKPLCTDYKRKQISDLSIFKVKMFISNFLLHSANKICNGKDKILKITSKIISKPCESWTTNSRIWRKPDFCMLRSKMGLKGLPLALLADLTLNWLVTDLQQPTKLLHLFKIVFNFRL